MPHSANASGSMGSSVGFGSTPTLRTVDPSWMDDSVNAGALSSLAAPEPPLHPVSFSESVDHSAIDTASVTSEKPPPQEGLHSVFHFLYHYCPSAASEMLVRASRSCEFESLFASETQPRVEEPPPILFHRIAEIWAQSQEWCQSIAEGGRLPSAVLPSRRRSPVSCSKERLRCTAAFNSNLPRLVGNLSLKRSFNMSFDEASKVESLLKGMMDSHSFAFLLLSPCYIGLRNLVSFLLTQFCLPS